MKRGSPNPIMPQATLITNRGGRPVEALANRMSPLVFRRASSRASIGPTRALSLTLESLIEPWPAR